MMNLAGKTILLTRTAEGNIQWAARIEAMGGRAISLPCISCETIREAKTTAALRQALNGADWLVCTSRRGVEAVTEIHPEPLPDSIRIAAVGNMTRSAAVSRFGRCDLVGRTGTGAGLARELAETVSSEGPAEGLRVVAATAEPAARSLEEVLEPLGVEVKRIIVYRTVPAAEKKIKQSLALLNLDAIVLASPSAVRGLLNIAAWEANIPIISIGPTTTRQARSLGLEVTAEAGYPDLESILEVLS
jgi:uroporphyrinogen-III synthase